MSLEATIQENTAALRDLIAVLANGATPTAAQVAAVVTEAKAEKVEKPAKKTQAAATQESPTPTASDNSASSSSATQEPDVAAPTYQDAAGAITKLSRTKGRDAAVALLTKFGAAKLPDVKPEQFAEVIQAATAAMEG